MVFPYSKRVPPKSFVRSRLTETQGFREPRPARTPPSTFLFLHLHLSNSLGPKPRPIHNGAFEDPPDDKWQPIKTGCSFTHHNEELPRHENSPWPRAKAAPRSVGRVIGPPY